MRYAHVPVKQAVISPSALSLMYSAESIRDYSRDQFIDDPLSEHETEIRRCLQKGAHNVQVDFTEGRGELWFALGIHHRCGFSTAWVNPELQRSG
jgi:5-methyltetrahydropteroyltriglutamate--homocysteine methyltransferase